VAIQLDQRLLSQKIQEDGNPLTGGHDPRDDRPKSVKGTPGNLHLGADFQSLLDHAGFIVSDQGLQLLDRFLRYGWPEGSEMDDSSDAKGMLNPRQES